MMEQQPMQQLIQILREGNHSLVLCPADGNIRSPKTYDGRGVADLFRLLGEQRSVLQNAMLADKVVGKGAAALMVLGGVQSVYAEVMSRPAHDVLAKAGVHVACGQLVDHIVNRAGTGMCPVEARCLPCATPGECLGQITAFLEEMKSSKAKQQKIKPLGLWKQQT